jgi:hypothetical protein
MAPELMEDTLRATVRKIDPQLPLYHFRSRRHSGTPLNLRERVLTIGYWAIAIEPTNRSRQSRSCSPLAEAKGAIRQVIAKTKTASRRAGEILNAHPYFTYRCQESVNLLTLLFGFWDS